MERRSFDLPAFDDWLSDAEHAQLERLRMPKRRSDWRLGRWTAKCAIAACLRQSGRIEPLSAIELRAAPSGAPEILLYGQPIPVLVSLSHSRGAAVCTVAPSGLAVGCDIEAVEPRIPAFLSDYFTDEERRLAALTPPDLRDRLVTILWSAKESALKALGCGLRLDTRSVNAAPDGILSPPDEHWHRLSVRHCAGAFHGWWRESRRLVRTVVADPAPSRPFPLPPIQAAHLRPTLIHRASFAG